MLAWVSPLSLSPGAAAAPSWNRAAGVTVTVAAQAVHSTLGLRLVPANLLVRDALADALAAGAARCQLFSPQK